MFRITCALNKLIQLNSFTLQVIRFSQEHMLPKLIKNTVHTVQILRKLVGFILFIRLLVCLSLAVNLMHNLHVFIYCIYLQFVF